jgi:hypothetical protein
VAASLGETPRFISLLLMDGSNFAAWMPGTRPGLTAVGSPRNGYKGLSILSPRRQAFPRISKLFSLAVSRKIKGLSVTRAGIAFSPILRRLGRDERPGDTPPNALAIQFRAIIGKKLSAAIFRRGLEASAAAHAPTRKPTAATAARRNFGRERRRGAGRPRSRKSGADCGSRNWAIRILSA